MELWNNSEDFDDQPCCENPLEIICDDGCRVCQNCGVVLGQEYVIQERRAYTNEEVKNRRTTEPRWRNYGPRTLIGTYNSDIKGKHLESKRQQLFSRLSKIQGSLINSIERNFWESRPKLSNFCNKLHVPDYICDTAWKIYAEVAKQKLTMGRSIEGFVSAALYAAIRIHDFPRLLEELVEVSMIPMRSIHRSLGIIIRLILPPLNMRYKPISPEPLIYRFGNELNLNILTQKKGAELLSQATLHGMRKMGKDPKGLAAAVLYLASKISGERRTQTDIARIARITEVTLRTRAKQVKEFF